MYRSIQWYECTVRQRQVLTELQLGPGSKLYFSESRWEALTAYQQQVLAELKFCPGCEFYIPKLRRLPDATLAERIEQHVLRGSSKRHAIWAIATEFARPRRTVAKRVTRLGGYPPINHAGVQP